MDKIIDLSKICKEFFIKKANELSITTGFIKRRRKITGSAFGSAFVRTLILGNMADGNCSIEGMCQLLWEDAVDITKQGLDFREVFIKLCHFKNHLPNFSLSGK